ncbi:unnamed protein product [Albugo candida]|uniref:Uncharacterized protein n=1 Tax=Albugo candida TaxID=65357 RepID=A0A024GLD3_9STRA|nr:unnamed protein product [Albugo candida]|eukprot:CCI47152.1 unnamed protein product [Albugo candida]
MARMLDLVTELKGVIVVRLTRLEARRLEDGQTSVVSASSITFPSCAEKRADLRKDTTLSSTEDKVIPSTARLYAPGKRHPQAREAGGEQGMPLQPPRVRSTDQCQHRRYIAR